MKEIIKEIVHELFDIDCDIELSRPNADFGDYATNVALKLAKPLKMAPRSIAESIAGRLQQRPEFQAVSVAGPGFINITINGTQLAERLDAQWSTTYGQNRDGEGKTVLVEFPSANIAKPYSVGHLRAGNQGWAAKRLMEASGWQVITDNHLGDYGAPFGMWVVGFIHFSNEEKLQKDGVYELGRVYIEVRHALKEEAANGESTLAKEVESWLLKLEQGDPEAVQYSQRFSDISLGHIHEIMQRLGISTDYELGESFFAPKGKAAVQDLLSQGVAKQNDDGSVIVPLDDYGIDTPLLVQKSNGAALYATTDLATILYRQERWSPDRVIYSVGAEQQFYFRQLFAMAKKIGVKTDLIHLWFGTIDQITEDGTREKMSSRKGVVLMEELLDTAEQKARELVGDRSVSDDDIKKIALGAVKFTDFVADRRTNILFDWNTIFALSGMSGPYVQYAAVRVNKLLHDVPNPGVKEPYEYEAEKAVLLKLLDFPDIVRSAAELLEPHRVANYLYELARDMNRYYESTRIIDSSDSEKTARLDVLAKVSQVFSYGLSLLGIDVPAEM